MSITDTLQLNKSAMFAEIRAGLFREPLAERQYTQNLIDCKDDLLFVWNTHDCCILVINWRLVKQNGIEKVKHQTLLPSVPQNFVVDRLVTSIEGSLIALAGPRGIAILEVPRRWGQQGLFMEGKDKVICRCHNLDMQLFSNVPHLELRQLRWHPASPTDSHLLVLLSDNTIRLYDSATLRHVWRIGPLPQGNADSNANSSIISTVQALGETVVDFDIAPAVTVHDSSVTVREIEDLKNSNSVGRLSTVSGDMKSLNETNLGTKPEKIVWPLVILRENGNIYILLAGLDSDKPRLQGPLTITPQTVDNYGVDSCAILVIPSLPPTLVIAETNGKLHHAMLLDAESAEDSFNEIDKTLNIHPSEWTVHVLETVELELGLSKSPQKDRAYHSPIHMKRDFINELRYFAYHNAGLHVVSVNFIDELQRFLDSDVNSDAPQLTTPSKAEYIVCTKINETEERINAVLGFVLLQMPSGIVLLLSSGQVISLKLVIDPKLLELDPAQTKAELNKEVVVKNDVQNELNKLLDPSFVDHIKNMLKRTVSQPILSLDKTSNTPSMHECYELLTQAKEVLRTEYIKRHELVRTEFTKRLNTIKLCKEQQYRDIEQLEKDREQIRERAHRLAERFEELNDQQELVSRRCQDLVRQANTCLPNNSIAEKEFAQKIERVNNATKSLAATMQKARDAINKQCYHISKYKETAKQKSFVLPQRQEKLIKDILTEMDGEIRSQVREVKRVNKIVGI